jgi:hypothetical protein
VALCHEKEGRTATAWAEFTEALGIAKKDDRPQRIELAQTHIAALEPTLSRLVIQVPEASDFPELEIKRDGGVIRRAAWGTAMPVDPGEHAIEASGHGKIAWHQTVTVGGRADTKTIVVPALENAPVVAQATPTVQIATGGTPGETRAPNRAAAGWVALGFGAVGVGVGTYFGLHALSQQKEADIHCDGTVCRDHYGTSQNDSAIKSANLSTVGFSIGAVGAALGIYLLVSSGSSRSSTATTTPALGTSISRDGADVTVSGRF